MSGPPNFYLLWSSRKTATGNYLGAYIYCQTSYAPSDLAQFSAQNLIDEKARKLARFIWSIGFVVLGTPPAAGPDATAFAQAVVRVINGYPFRQGANPPYGGMILWLDALHDFTRASTFGLFTPAPGSPITMPYRLDSGATHRLFDAGGGNRLLSVNAGAPAAPLKATGDMAIAVDASPNPLLLSFGASAYYSGTAIETTTLTVDLDPTHANAGCLVCNGTVRAGLRNFQLGFQHELVPQAGLGGGALPPSSTIFHPLLDPAETLDGASVTAVLNPLAPTAPFNTLQITPANKSFVSAYRSQIADAITLAPAGAKFQALPAPAGRSYFAPRGAFTLGVQGPTGGPPPRLIGGLSSVEYIEVAAGDTLTFSAAPQNAGIGYTIQTDPDGKSYTTFAPDPDGSAAQVSWAQITPAAARNFVTESETEPFFAGPAGFTAQTPLDFKEVPLRALAAQTPSPLIPLFPYAGLDFGPDGKSGNAGVGPDTAAAFERSYVVPTRLSTLETGAVLKSGSARTWAVTPQGYIVQFDGGAITSVTLGAITSGSASKGQLVFGSDANPISANQDVCNAFLANQQFIVATRVPAKVDYIPSANLSGWTFNVDLATGSVVPGAYQTVLIVKSAIGTIKSLVAESSAWTAYAAFNDTSIDREGDMLSTWLVAYLAQAEALYANGTGLTGLQSFHDLINDPDWNGYIYLHVPIDIGKLDPGLQFLTSGIDPKQFFAHHVGCAVNHTTVNNGAYQANSSYLGLVHYLRAGADPDDLTGTPPFVPQSVDFDFQLLTLEARFENSVLVDFRSSAQLVASKLFNDVVLAKSPDPLVVATDAVLIYGSMQTTNNVPHYVFATAKGASSTFFLASAAFERAEIDRVAVEVGAKDPDGYHTATFDISGWFGLLPAATFDVLSFAAVPFAKLALDMRFQTGHASTYAMRTDRIMLGQLPARSLQTGERITSASAAANVVYRPGSLASGFPLTAARLITVDASDPSKPTPASLGYRDLVTQVSLGGATVAAPWYGLELDLPLGGGGALSSGSLFTAKMLFAWMPGGSGAVAIQPGFKLQGPGGTNLTLDIEGVLKLGAAGLFLSQNKKGQFILELASLGITVLSKSFPPAGSTNLLLAGIAKGDQRFLGWFGAYDVEKSA